MTRAEDEAAVAAQRARQAENATGKTGSALARMVQTGNSHPGKLPSGAPEGEEPDGRERGSTGFAPPQSTGGLRPDGTFSDIDSGNSWGL